MKIYAIGIYNDSQRDFNGFHKVNFAPEKSSTPHYSASAATLFTFDPLVHIEETLRATPNPLQPHQVYDRHFKNNTHSEFQYIMKTTDDLVVAICSRQKLQPNELQYLFRNIMHAHLRSKNTNITLQNIIDNPLMFIGRDAQIASLKQNVDETKQIMLENLDKMFNNMEKTEALVEKTENLVDLSETFRKKSAKLNTCQC